MERNQRRRGEVFSVQLGPLKRCTFIADPEIAWQILTGDRELMRMGSTNGIFRPVLGDSSLFLLDGDEHRRHRNMLMPAFHRGAIRRLSGLVSELAARDLASWPDGETFPLQERMRVVTLEMILRVVIGIPSPEREERLRELIHGLLDLVQNPIAVLPQFQRELGGRSPYAKLMAQVREIDEVLFEEINHRRLDPSRHDHEDVLSMLVRAQTHEEAFMTDREVRDELLTLLVAGHETTATALSWCFERLLRHPEALEQAIAEVDSTEESTYIDAVIKEALRLRPVLPITARKLTAPVRIGGYVYPKGWTLMPCIYLIHRDPVHFPDPDEFRPERFLGPDAPTSRVWLPFGAGSRHCIGSGVALMTIRTVLRTVLERVRLEADRPASERVVRRNFTLGPEHGAQVRLIGRREGRRGAAVEPVSGT